jgi:hypothetical protein
MHITLLILLPAFAWLTWWQLGRALNGNTLSWAYTFEWPLFAGYAVYVWWQLIHDQARGASRAPAPTTAAPAGAEDHDHPGWALTGGWRKSVAIAAASAVDESHPPHGERFAEQTPEEAAELAEYNRYLARLNEADSATDRR